MSVRNFDYAVYSKNPQFEEEEVRMGCTHFGRQWSLTKHSMTLSYL